jgi:HD-GYP domain-containing protein (c-di-GMP phosphodiesterase class II)
LKSGVTDKSRLIADARAAVLEQTKNAVFNVGPYERATELLESVPFAAFVDDRVQLALDIAVATRTDHRPDLSRRALYAAFPAGSELKDAHLKRKWFTFAGAIEIGFGNVHRALEYKLVALELCEELKDWLGFCAEWCNFSTIAAGAGLYHDAVQYSTIAIEGKGDGNPNWLGLRSLALVNRAHVLARLGRFADAEADVLSSLICLTYPVSPAVLNQIVTAQGLFAEIRLERGDRFAAQNAVQALSTWVDASGIPLYRLQIDRIRARLLAFEDGIEKAVSRLKTLLEEAHQLEAKLGQSASEDYVLDILHSLERVHREHSDVEGANNWLKAIGERLRKNAARMLDALADNPLFADASVAGKVLEIDKYLQTKAAARPGGFGSTESSWNYLVALAASASGVEDPTKEHGVRVAKLAGLLTHELGLPQALQHGIQLGCLVHDVGKVSVPASVLMKRTPLNTSEQHLYDAHANVGAELLERLKHPEQSVLRNVVRFHHQPYAGSTPQHLPMGEAIPLEARIAAVCDEYDSLVTGRPRRPAITGNEALREIFAQRAGKFDPKIVDVFVEIVRRLHRTHPDLQGYLSEEAESLEYFAMQRSLKRAAERALANE